MTKKTKQLTAPQFDKLFPNEEACDNYLVANRWPKGIHCPRCGSTNVYPLQTMKFKWECPDCREGGAYRFSHLVGTIFENTKVDLRDWFKVIHLMLTAKKGISALQIQRFMGFGSYKTAWYVCHRIRTALQDKEFRKLMGIVEVDETFIGGKKSNRHKSKRGKRQGDTRKAVIVGAVERKGSVVTRVLESLSAVDLQRFVRETVSTKVSLLATDEQSAYKALREYPHKTVMHSAEQYVVGAVHRVLEAVKIATEIKRLGKTSWPAYCDANSTNDATILSLGFISITVPTPAVLESGTRIFVGGRVRPN